MEILSLLFKFFLSFYFIPFPIFKKGKNGFYKHKPSRGWHKQKKKKTSRQAERADSLAVVHMANLIHGPPPENRLLRMPAAAYRAAATS